MALSVTPLTSVSATSSTVLKALEQSGFSKAGDLLTFYPRRYVDRTNQVNIQDAEIDTEVLILGVVTSVTSRFRGKGSDIVLVEVSDSSGQVQITFFNQSWRKHQLKVGLECALFGKLSLFGRQRRMVNPLVDLVGDRTGRIVSIYPHSEKFHFKSEVLPKVIALLLGSIEKICDPLPELYRNQMRLISRDEAFRAIHLPQSPSDHIAARKRLAFDELLRIQLYLVASKVAYQQSTRGIRHLVGRRASMAYIDQRTNEVGPNKHNGDLPQPMSLNPNVGHLDPTKSNHNSAQLQLDLDNSDNDMVDKFYTNLGFAPTGAQRRVIGEIALDMASNVPMHRLLQGDVGSGKTLVAIVAGLFALQGGYQVAILAPTEVLAEQHYLNISRLCNHLEIEINESTDLFNDLRRNVRIGLLTNKVPASKRRSVIADLACGEIDFIVGTHSLLSEGVTFHKLGLVVVDEQHRFGVEQRSLLRERTIEQGGIEPDMLIMTATPIPRTAAMTIFGDLDYSVLDELPPGRTPVLTRWAKEQDQVDKTYARVRSEVAAMRQCYVVCPLVEDSEKIQARSAVAVFEELSSNALKGIRLGLLHGQMPSVEKTRVMESFRNGEIDVLVSTTVIEVGVDVPNATVMVIQDAGRFGISQIHQLRGRVGRGAHTSYCYLIETSEVDDTTRQRLDACVSSTDGFALAERDLELRGEGTIFGSRQKGRSDLRVASLVRDKKVVVQAREVAKAIVGNDPSLSGFVALLGELQDTFEEDEAAFLFRN